MNKEPLVVQQYKFMEQVYGTNITDIILSQQVGDENLLSLKSAKKILHDADCHYIWEQVSSQQSLAALSCDINWRM